MPTEPNQNYWSKQSSPGSVVPLAMFSKEAYFVAYKTQNFGQFWLFCHKFTHFLCTFTGPNNAAAVLNLKNIRYALLNAPDLPSHDVKLYSLFKGSQNRKHDNDDRKVPTRIIKWMNGRSASRQVVR